MDLDRLALQADGYDGYRLSLCEKVRHRFGALAVERLKPRLSTAAGAEVRTWERRAAYALSYAELFEEKPLPVEVITAERLLRHAFGSPLRKPAVLLRFRRSKRRQEDIRLLRRRAAWLADLPQADFALQFLRFWGWLLIACDGQQRACLLHQSAQGPREGRFSSELITPEHRFDREDWFRRFHAAVAELAALLREEDREDPR